MWLHCAAVFVQSLSSAQVLQWFPVFCNYKQAAINNPVHMYIFTLLEVGLQGKFLVALLAQKVNAYVVLSHIAKSPPKWLYQFAFPPAMYNGGCFLTGSPTECVVILFNFCKSGRWETIPQCSFNLHFSNYGYGWTAFQMFKYHFYTFSGDCLFSSFSIPFLFFLPFVRVKKKMILGILALYLWYMSQQVGCLQTLKCCIFFLFMVEVLLILGSTFITR